MASSTVRQRAHRVQWFLTVQFIALVGWIIVQSTFSLSPLGRTLGFTATLVIEAIWWIITLVIMFWLFRREYSGFVRSVIDLEEANNKLRRTTNEMLLELRNPDDQ
jgi:hypothetical protein